MTQQENNKLIAEFMGFKKLDNGTLRTTKKYGGNTIGESDTALFRSSWDWLMPVVEKIKRVCDLTTECPINRKRVELFKSVSIFSDISEVYKCCTAFVEWYNQNNAK